MLIKIAYLRYAVCECCLCIIAIQLFNATATALNCISQICCLNVALISCLAIKTQTAIRKQKEAAVFNLSVTASSCRLPYRGEALAWQKAQSLRQRLPSVGELSNEVRLRGCFYSDLLFFCYLLFFSFRLFGLLLLTQLFDALFLALDARPWPREALVLFAPAGERIERESQPEQVQQNVQQA